ncbi:MAG: saccharopine dehydrogenase NADP-binding domain-containing protein [Desulfobacterales bacterium]|nr:saccharopine dehydrogenase NADP-binding domain-containing protein [Desulfobacterales bacterium]
MKKILILGAGLVSKPGVVFLLENKFSVTVASRTVEKAQGIVQGFENGTALQFDVEDSDMLERLIKEHDITVSLLPWIHHVTVAKCCLKNNKDMATASYVSADMKKLDSDVKSSGLTFLNEIGVDPGTDHMSAMKIIDRVHSDGGKIKHFYSICGGLPAPDDNDNPFGYKFSWSPKGVVLASKNPARFLENGKEINIEGKDLFLNKRIENVEGLGDFEVFPNRDSIPYKEIYGLKDAETVMRGTYRYVGWCDTLKKMVDLGLVDDAVNPDLKGNSYRKMMADIAGVSESDDVVAKIAEKAGLPIDHFVINNLDWLGLFAEDKVPDADNRLDILSERLLERLKYQEGEKDMIILKHTFVVENKDKSKQTITSTLIDYGIPHGDSSMARTVSLPLAIGIKLMAEGEINRKGILIPITKDIYEPVLAGLEKQNINFVEKTV